MDSGDFAGARGIAQALIAQPLTAYDPVEDQRLLSLIAKHEGDLAGAEAALTQAMTAFLNSPTLPQRVPSMRAAILMDQAELAAFHRHNIPVALGLFDQVRSLRGTAKAKDLWVACQNAAMLRAEAGEWAQAIQDTDELLSWPDIVAVIPTSQMVSLKASQAAWMANAGDAPGAFEKARAVWEQYQTRDEDGVFAAGLRVADGYPSPQSCDQRIAVATAVLERINQCRSNPSGNPAAASSERLAEYERQALTVIANSFQCENYQAQVMMARYRLGLPLVLP